MVNASSKIASDLSYLLVSLESSESAASLWAYSVSLEGGHHWLCLLQTATFLINRVLSLQGHGLLMDLTVRRGPRCPRQIWHSFSASLQQAQTSPPAAHMCTCLRQCEGGSCSSYISEEKQLSPGWVNRERRREGCWCCHLPAQTLLLGASQVDQKALTGPWIFFFFSI